jgi:fermentation-respiration switch protein FrsA (DUF1100 family)
MRGVTILQILGSIAGLYALICAVVWLVQDKMVFFPDRQIEATPDMVGLKYKDAAINTEDGLSLHGWFVPATDARWTVIFCHGNAGNISHRLETLLLLNDLGLSVLIFDYRGYGHSEGKPSEAGLYRDVRAAWRHAVEVMEVPPERIIVWGRSLGGSAAVAQAAEVEPAALVVESTFTRASDMARATYPWLPVRLILRLRLDSEARVGGIACPKLFVHSRQDEVVPFELGRRLFAAAATPKEFLEVSGGHNDGFLVSGARYREGIVHFINGLPEKPALESTP